MAHAVRERWLCVAASRTASRRPGQAGGGRGREARMLKGDDWPSLSAKGAARRTPCAGRVGRSLRPLAPHYHPCRPQACRTDPSRAALHGKRTKGTRTAALQSDRAIPARHCEERSDEATQTCHAGHRPQRLGRVVASLLAMTPARERAPIRPARARPFSPLARGLPSPRGSHQRGFDPGARVPVRYSRSGARTSHWCP